MSINDKKFQQISTFFLDTYTLNTLVHVIIYIDLGGCFHEIEFIRKD